MCQCAWIRLIEILLPRWLGLMRILLSGSTGLVGSAVARQLASGPGYELILPVRERSNCSIKHQVIIGGIDARTDWFFSLQQVERVIHCAARVHVMHETAVDALSAFRAVNVEGTLHLARSAAAAGVRRFIFLSSVKVLGEQSAPGRPFTTDDPLVPTDAYGISKMEAEQGLLALAVETGMEVVIIRPPLVYGPGVKANFLSMMQWLQRGIPLPLGAIDNRRSLVALDNLVDLIVTCIEHPAAANQVFLVSDGEDLSTPELLRRMGQALGTPARLLPVPVSLLELGASLLGKRLAAQRLCSSLQVDISKTRELLGWEPPVSVDEALRKTALDFLGRAGD
jgi:nucleoside-diphosphate-sugar epimerase